MMILLAAQKTLVNEHTERIPSKTPGRYGLNTPRGTDSGDPHPDQSPNPDCQSPDRNPPTIGRKLALQQSSAESIPGGLKSVIMAIIVRQSEPAVVQSLMIR